mmetsp:Transcript_27252/g.44405  ORF Transcript_27252/g.44405 Transcript_27252/m.44405 type:complete len:200 (-) Transcript_27252:118-717(-)
MAMASCLRASEGNGILAIFSKSARNSPHTSFIAEASRSVSSFTPREAFTLSRSASNLERSRPRQTSANIWMKRRNESYAHLGFPEAFPILSTLTALRPKFSTVSIIPGIEMTAPERTERRTGSSGAPNFFPSCFSNCETHFSTCPSRPAGHLPVLVNEMHAVVVMVKPGGTGRPRFVISLKLAPFPPRRALSFLLPSPK